MRFVSYTVNRQLWKQICKKLTFKRIQCHSMLIRYWSPNNWKGLSSPGSKSLLHLPNSGWNSGDVSCWGCWLRKYYLLYLYWQQWRCHIDHHLTLVILASIFEFGLKYLLLFLMYFLTRLQLFAHTCVWQLWSNQSHLHQFKYHLSNLIQSTVSLFLWPVLSISSDKKKIIVW